MSTYDNKDNIDAKMKNTKDSCNYNTKCHFINNDLYNNQYTEEELISNIDYLLTSTIMKTQTNLSKEFIDNYILNEKYHADDNDDTCLDELLIYQNQYGKKKNK